MSDDSTHPNPAIGALKSEEATFSSNIPSSLIVVYKYLALSARIGTATHVQIMGTALLGIPPPSSEILIVISSEPSTTTTRIGGNASSLSDPNRSTTARREFFSSSKQMWELKISACVGNAAHRWPGT